MNFEKTYTASPDDIACIERGLTDHNLTVTGTPNETIVFLAREKGEIRGGLKALKAGPSFLIKFLWVNPDWQKKGIGKALMKMAEEEAQLRECTRLHVDTMEFRSPDFYKRLGYEVKAIIKDYSRGYDRIYFEKQV